MLSRLAAVALGTALLLGCSKDSTGPTRTDVSGTWRGGLESATVTLILTHTADAVNGSGTMVAGTTSVALSAFGSVTQPDAVTLTLTASGFQPISYTGTVKGGVMSGTANGSGFSNTSMTLTKQ